MILEVAILDVKPGDSRAFESAFTRAESLLRSAKGYVAHDIRHCIEKQDRYILLVHWERLEDHTEGFRKSPEYQEWRKLLHHFYDPFPTVEHYEPLSTKTDSG
ncbi:MAG: antibiotic biosynthesis monooxygenase [Thaumarchaeota archaeon]|nr:antibiotic biosynthesis monooxygenase [Nitrososphaerota archaeon]